MLKSMILMMLILFSLGSMAQEKAEVAVAGEVLESYVGNYELAPGIVFKITHKEAGLFSQLSGQTDFQVFPESETRFNDKLNKATLEFFKDENGKVSHLILHQNGMSQKATRLEGAPVAPPKPVVSAADAAKLKGNWLGRIEGVGLRLRVKFEFDEENRMSCKLVSPDQGTATFEPSRVTFEEDQLTFEVGMIAASYTGTYQAEGPAIKGTFVQRGQSFPLNLTQANRPQNPIKPYPYHEEEVRYPATKGRHELAGTLTLPKEGGPFTAVIMISGSGPQDRDEALLDHKPFLVISDYFTRKGLAVLRFDDRGTAKSSGNYASATMADFADDVEAGIAYLKTRPEINPQKIGLAGHSEGGVVGPMVAARNKDVAFVVMMAGTGVNGEEVILYQMDLMARKEGEDEKVISTNHQILQKVIEQVNEESDPEVAAVNLKKMLEHEASRLDPAMAEKIQLNADSIEKYIESVNGPWFRYFLTYDPAPALKQVSCPVLALFCEKDLQVAPAQNLEPVRKALSANKQAIVKLLPGLNHLFQTADKGIGSEYSKIEETIAPLALETMADWILDISKN